jgi:hypothetical protein
MRREEREKRKEEDNLFCKHIAQSVAPGYVLIGR